MVASHSQGSKVKQFICTMTSFDYSLIGLIANSFIKEKMENLQLLTQSLMSSFLHRRIYKIIALVRSK